MATAGKLIDDSKFNLDLTKVISKVELKSRTFLRDVAFDIAEGIVVGNPEIGSPGTPVDTGFARASWWISLGDEGSPVQPPDNPDKTRTIKYTRNAEKPTDSPKLLNVQLGQTVFILSNCRYMRDLEHGHSQRQAPHGMIGLTMNAVHTIVRLAREARQRESKG